MKSKTALTKEQARAGFTPDTWAAYELARNTAAAVLIYGDPFKKKRRIPEQESWGGPHDWLRGGGHNPHAPWKNKQR